MKKLFLLPLLLLTGCVAAPYYYVPPAPVYVQPAPVYVAPPVYYRPAPPVYYRAPSCVWTTRWNSYTGSYQNIRVCR